MKLRQFDLQFAFAGAGALRENFQDQRRPVHDLAAENFLQVAGLRRGEFIVKDDGVHVVLLAGLGEFLSLALADVGGSGRRSHLLHAFAQNLRAGGRGELGELGERFTDVGGAAGIKFHADKKNAHGARVAGLDERFQGFVATE